MQGEVEFLILIRKMHFPGFEKHQILNFSPMAGYFSFLHILLNFEKLIAVIILIETLFNVKIQHNYG